MIGGPRMGHHVSSVARRLRSISADYGKPTLSAADGNELIGRFLASQRPVAIARMGSTELKCVWQYLVRSRGRKGFSQSVRHDMSILSGFFPTTEQNLRRFCCLFLESLRSCDLVGIWYNPHEDAVCRTYCPQAEYAELRSLEPYYHQRPWSQFLKGRRVLVVHPYARTIEAQYANNRERLFKDARILPKFDLVTIQAVQSIAGEETEFGSWFDAYQYMCDEISNCEFDVAIIGAGAYGLPLSAFVRRLGRQAVHMGGATQVLFGIKGRRWDGHPFISKLYNENWVRPSDSERPKGYKKVEGGCYW